MRRRRKTKILATLGPSSNTRAKMHELFDAGVDVFRINMSHTSHDLLRQMVGDLRAAGCGLGCGAIGVLPADGCGVMESSRILSWLV